MEIAIIQNGSITIGDYRDMFPNTSFTASGPSDEFLAEQGAKKLNRFKTYDALTQKLVACGAYDDGEFVSVVQVESLTAEEIQSAKDSAMANIRGQRDRLLSACDWTQLPDCSIPKKAEWATYRQALRDLPESVEDARTFSNWPKDPEWKEMGAMNEL
jgi:hypothetical protein